MGWRETYDCAVRIVWVAARAFVPILGNGFVPVRPFVLTGIARDGEEGFEHVRGQKAVGVGGGMIRHEVDNEVMCNWGNKPSKGLKTVNIGSASGGLREEIRRGGGIRVLGVKRTKSLRAGRSTDYAALKNHALFCCGHAVYPE